MKREEVKYSESKLKNQISLWSWKIISNRTDKVIATSDNCSSESYTSKSKNVQGNVEFEKAHTNHMRSSD